MLRGFLVTTLLAILAGYWLLNQGDHPGSKCPMEAISSFSKRLQGWLTNAIPWGGQHSHAESNELPSKADQIDLPLCMMRPMEERDLQPYKHVSLLGQVYDVSESDKFYGPDGAYAYLTGHDATRELAMSALAETESDEMTNQLRKGYALDGLSNHHLDELITWMHFYKTKYKCIGFLPGTYFDAAFQPTDYLNELLGAWSRLRKEANQFYDSFALCDQQYDDKHKIVLYACKKATVPRNVLIPTKKDAQCFCIPSSVALEPTARMTPIHGCAPENSICERTQQNLHIKWPNHLTLLNIL